MGVVFGLIALFGWAVGDIFVTKASRRVGNIRTLFWQLVISFVLSSFYLPFVLPIKNFGMLFFSFFLGLILFAGTLSYFKALEIGTASLAGAISGSYPILIVLLSLAIYHERLNFQQVVGIALTTLGVTLVSFVWKEIKNFKIGNFFSDRGIKYSLFALIAFGIYLTLVKIPSLEIGWFWQPYTYSFSFLVLIIHSLVKKEKLGLPKERKSIIPILVSAVLLIGAHFAYNIGVLKGFVSIVGPITGCQAVVFVILAQIFFKEKMSRQQIAGVVLTLLGILLLSV